MDLRLFPMDFDPAEVDDEGFIEEEEEGETEYDQPEAPERSTQASNTTTDTWDSEQQLADQDRPPRDTDPYVQVERYHENLPSLLKDQSFRDAMRMHFPPPTEHEGLNIGNDIDIKDNIFDTVQYLALREWVRDSLLVQNLTV